MRLMFIRPKGYVIQDKATETRLLAENDQRIVTFGKSFCGSEDNWRIFDALKTNPWPPR